MSATPRDRPLQLEQIVSGGQTGVDRAALDVALELGIPCGGWCPQGRLAEDGVIAERYPLRETRSARYSRRTLCNVRDSDATLIVVRGEPAGGTAYTVRVAQDLERPYLVVPPDVTHVARTLDWLRDDQVVLLNVAGPRESGAPGTYVAARLFLHELLQAVLGRRSRVER